MQSIIMYTDGSTKPNPKPGYSGFGIFGYSFTETPGKRPYKHPGDIKYYFTETGLSLNKSNLLVMGDVYEHIEFIRGTATTNNQIELCAVVRAVEISLAQPDVNKITIITDSAYVFNCYKDSFAKWRENGYKRTDNKEIAYITEWNNLSELVSQGAAKDIAVDIQWVKSHADDYGNYLADLYSTVGSNCANIDSTAPIENPVILSQKINYLDYGKTYEKKDIIYHFKDMYFSSNELDDSTYCFLYNTADVESNTGRRNTESIFALNTGYVPEAVNKLKAVHRALSRSFTTTCGIKLNKLNNKDILRLINYIDPRYMVYENNGSYYLMRDTSAFLYDVKGNIPLIMNVNNVFNQIQLMDNKATVGGQDIYTIDITDLIIQDKKVAFTNQVTSLDISKRIQDSTKVRFIFKQTIFLNVGYDIPSYMVLKNIEDTISSVLLYISVDNENSVATVYCKLILENRELLVTNIVNKFSCVVFNLQEC